jgi:hypothetical protein
VIHSGRLRPYLQTLDSAGKACKEQTLLANNGNPEITTVKSFVVQAQMFRKLPSFQSSLKFAGKDGAYQSGAPFKQA